MTPMPVLGTMTEWLRAHGKTQPEIDSYALRFARLRDADPTPCPVCYLEMPDREIEQPLMLLARQGNDVPLFCPRCRTMFRIPVEYAAVPRGRTSIETGDPDP